MEFVMMNLIPLNVITMEEIVVSKNWTSHFARYYHYVKLYSEIIHMTNTLLQECQCKGKDCPDLIEEKWGNGKCNNNRHNNAGCFFDGGDCCKGNRAKTEPKCKDKLAKAKNQFRCGK